MSTIPKRVSNSIITLLPEYLWNLREDLKTNPEELIEYLKPTSINLTAGLLQKLKDELKDFNTWKEKIDYEPEFMLDELFKNLGHSIAITQVELLKGFFKFKGTSTDVAYVMGTSGAVVEIHDSDYFIEKQFEDIIVRTDFKGIFSGSVYEGNNLDYFIQKFDKSTLVNSYLKEKLQPILDQNETDAQGNPVITELKLKNPQEFFEHIGYVGDLFDDNVIHPQPEELLNLNQAVAEWSKTWQMTPNQMDCAVTADVGIDMDSGHFEGAADVDALRKKIESLIVTRLSICTRLQSISLKFIMEDIYEMSRIIELINTAVTISHASRYDMSKVHDDPPVHVETTKNFRDYVFRHFAYDVEPVYDFVVTLDQNLEKVVTVQLIDVDKQEIVQTLGPEEFKFKVKPRSDPDPDTGEIPEKFNYFSSGKDTLYDTVNQYEVPLKVGRLFSELNGEEVRYLSGRDNLLNKEPYAAPEQIYYSSGGKDVYNKEQDTTTILQTTGDPRIYSTTDKQSYRYFAGKDHLIRVGRHTIDKDYNDYEIDLVPTLVNNRAYDFPSFRIRVNNVHPWLLSKIIKDADKSVPMIYDPVNKRWGIDPEPVTGESSGSPPWAWRPDNKAWHYSPEYVVNTKTPHDIHNTIPNETSWIVVNEKKEGAGSTLSTGIDKPPLSPINDVYPQHPKPVVGRREYWTTLGSWEKHIPYEKYGPDSDYFHSFLERNNDEFNYFSSGRDTLYDTVNQYGVPLKVGRSFSELNGEGVRYLSGKDNLVNRELLHLLHYKAPISFKLQGQPLWISDSFHTTIILNLKQEFIPRPDEYRNIALDITHTSRYAMDRVTDPSIVETSLHREEVLLTSPAKLEFIDNRIPHYVCGSREISVIKNAYFIKGKGAQPNVASDIHKLYVGKSETRIDDNREFIAASMGITANIHYNGTQYITCKIGDRSRITDAISSDAHKLYIGMETHIDDDRELLPASIGAVANIHYGGTRYTSCKIGNHVLVRDAVLAIHKLYVGKSETRIDDNRELLLASMGATANIHYNGTEYTTCKIGNLGWVIRVENVDVSGQTNDTGAYKVWGHASLMIPGRTDYANMGEAQDMPLQPWSPTKLNSGYVYDEVKTKVGIPVRLICNKFWYHHYHDHGIGEFVEYDIEYVDNVSVKAVGAYCVFPHIPKNYESRVTPTAGGYALRYHVFGQPYGFEGGYALPIKTCNYVYGKWAFVDNHFRTQNDLTLVDEIARPKLDDFKVVISKRSYHRVYVGKSETRLGTDRQAIVIKMGTTPHVIYDKKVYTSFPISNRGWSMVTVY